ncbi:hypothetical protein [Cylindrospermum sp. FACHB-282]|uniref:hypothetical protein n=1 Tax=Cylindrospermum sp. FACHB-282 TaxID=2692794 RepID=UPI001F552CB6|nr:hypothetical protein [Cylindrospermum sp. FACHB-282]
MNSQFFLNDELVQKRIDTFYGYGNYKGKYWFIGMEEAGGEDFNDINDRINIWATRGQKEIDDVAKYHEDMGAWDAKIQNTWKGLIRITLSANGKENIDTEDVRQYQVNKLGREDKETCLLELLPLPSPSINNWIYGKHSKIPFLSDRDTYRNYCIEKRINHISQRIKKYQPKAVVFYGMGYEYYWRKVTDIASSLSSFAALRLTHFVLEPPARSANASLVREKKAIPTVSYDNPNIIKPALQHHVAQQL